MRERPALIWDEWNKKHIRKHKITEEEVEDAFANEFGRNDSYYYRFAVYGKTKKGRLVTIIISFKTKTKFYVVTARDMSRKERRKYYDKIISSQTDTSI
jgi:uncharacterized DUF497 family protein